MINPNFLRKFAALFDDRTTLVFIKYADLIKWESIDDFLNQAEAYSDPIGSWFDYLGSTDEATEEENETIHTELSSLLWGATAGNPLRITIASGGEPASLLGIDQEKLSKKVDELAWRIIRADQPDLRAEAAIDEEMGQACSVLRYTRLFGHLDELIREAVVTRKRNIDESLGRSKRGQAERLTEVIFGHDPEDIIDNLFDIVIVFRQPMLSLTASEG